jgi:23S rRNA pseudouridine2605 synthase
MSEPMRIHRALARAGVASRRHAETLIAEGRVLVNGVQAKVGQSVNPAKDRVQVDGQPVSLDAPKSRWFVLNKPSGYMTTKRDPEGRRTVFDLVPEVPGLTYVGRLDFLTEGVLLLTTDGEAAHRLTHPSSEVERVYVATVRGNAKSAADEARKGVELEDGLVKPAWVNVQSIENRRWAFEVAIREGKTRRLCGALGLEVDRLVRTQFGPVRLGELQLGAWRELSPREATMMEVLTGTDVPAGVPPKKRDDRTPRAKDARSGRTRDDRPARPRGERPQRERGAKPAREGEERPARSSTARPARAGAARPERTRDERPPRDRDERPPRGEGRSNAERDRRSRDERPGGAGHRGGSRGTTRGAGTGRDRPSGAAREGRTGGARSRVSPAKRRSRGD